MITLVGVAHVFDLRSKVESLIQQKDPELVCVELDPMRYEAMRKPAHASKPLAYAMLASFQRRLARRYGVEVGSEMLTAINCAKRLGKKVAFIDMNSMETFARLWRAMKTSERIKLLMGSLFGLWMSKQRVERELEKFEKNYDQYMGLLGKAFPSLKRVLIDQRDEYMASRLKQLHRKYENILAVVGDGHVEGIRRLLRDVEPVRLRGLRKERIKISYEVDI